MISDFFSGNDGNNLLGILFGTLMGFMSSVTVEFIRKKNKKEQKIDEYESINESAERTAKTAQLAVNTAQMVSTMLEERLTQERKYFNDELNRSKEDCQNQIASMKTQYDVEIKILQLDLVEKEKELTLLRESLQNFTEGKNKGEN